MSSWFGCRLRPLLVLGICKPISPGWWNKDLTCRISTLCSARIAELHPPKSRASEEALVAISRQTGSRLPRTRAILISFFAHSTTMPNRTNRQKTINSKGAAVGSRMEMNFRYRPANITARHFYIKSVFIRIELISSTFDPVKCTNIFLKSLVY